MKREIIVHSWLGRLMGALIEDGHLCEYWIQDEGETAGQIIKGRVERIVPGMKAAFVQIGDAKNGFLPLDEGSGPLPLQTGQEILVQVKKAPQGTKGAYLSREISLPGSKVLLLPLTKRYGVSKRINQEEERRELLNRARSLAPEGQGLIMRGESLNASDECILREIGELQAQWKAILKEAACVNAPARLLCESTHLHRLMRDYSGRIDGLITDDPAVVKELHEKLPVQLYQGEMDLFHVYGIPKAVDNALRGKVWLKSGGYLVIDPCEALTVIDVNTGKYTGKRLLEETILKINLEACETIARQVRLRGLGGIIIVDFIDMGSQEHRDKVMEALKEAFKEDRQKTVLHGFTSLGLMEMTRKKDQPPLGQWLTMPCSHCQGSGFVKGADAIDT